MGIDEQKDIFLEACVETLEEAILAEKKGANRLEICSRLDLDGLTPDVKLIKKALKIISIPIKVMIRQRSGNFVYSEEEILAMKNQINIFKSIGVMEVVFGALNINNEIDIKVTNRLAKYAFPMKVTFHKAIDQTANILSAIENIKSKNLFMTGNIINYFKIGFNYNFFIKKTLNFFSSILCKFVSSVL